MSTEFLEKYHGTLRGVMKWENLDQLWDVIREKKSAGWFIYAPGHEIPEKIANANEVEHFITQIDELLHREHHEDYCGIVYADDLDAPSLVKIYDPNNLGASCGSSKNKPLPGWIMSTSKPADLQHDMLLPGNRKRWWQRLWD